jgi:hypothetical protein
MVSRFFSVGVATCVLALYASQAQAQVENRVAVGVAVMGQIADSSDTDRTVVASVEWRFRHDKPGWGWQYTALNWFETGLTQPIAGRDTNMGRLHIRPLMGGYGYTWVKRRTYITADLLAGYAFTSFDLDPAAEDTYRTRMGVRSVTTDSSNTIAINPEVHLWYDLNDRMGMKVTGGYVFARPSVTMTSSLGDDRREINADAFQVGVALVYKIF